MPNGGGLGNRVGWGPSEERTERRFGPRAAAVGASSSSNDVRCLLGSGSRSAGEARVARPE
jgi:hypothetical protein